MAPGDGWNTSFHPRDGLFSGAISVYQRVVFKKNLLDSIRLISCILVAQFGFTRLYGVMFSEQLRSGTLVFGYPKCPFDNGEAGML